jgi:hypothetical protein
MFKVCEPVIYCSNLLSPPDFPTTAPIIVDILQKFYSTTRAQQQQQQQQQQKQLERTQNHLQNT